MSRIGKAPVEIPEGVEVTTEGNTVVVKGKLGELRQEVQDNIDIKIEDNVLTLTRPNEEKPVVSKHGLYRALIANMIEGVSKGFEKRLELVGVGYRVQAQGQVLDLALGYSHNIMIKLPEEIKVKAEAQKGKSPTIILNSHDKQLIGMVAAKIRSLRKPEPYKGKGIRYAGEYIRRKAGKTAGK